MHVSSKPLVIVVQSNANVVQVSGKIVVYNQGWLGSYGAGGQYRGYGATEAARYGAKAALIRSVTPFSINSPHTGIQVGSNYCVCEVCVKDFYDLRMRIMTLWVWRTVDMSFYHQQADKLDESS